VGPTLDHGLSSHLCSFHRRKKELGNERTKKRGGEAKKEESSSSRYFFIWEPSPEFIRGVGLRLRPAQRLLPSRSYVSPSSDYRSLFPPFTSGRGLRRRRARLYGEHLGAENTTRSNFGRRRNTFCLISLNQRPQHYNGPGIPRKNAAHLGGVPEHRKGDRGEESRPFPSHPHGGASRQRAGQGVLSSPWRAASGGGRIPLNR